MDKNRILVMVDPPFAHVRCTLCGAQDRLDAPDAQACYDVMLAWGQAHVCPRWRSIAELFGQRITAN